jgi:23S rRNA (adenine2503-C2)-methyltransferase
MEERVNLVGASLEGIEAAIKDFGEPPYRARQVYGGIYRRRLLSWDEFTELSKSLRERLASKYNLGYPQLARAFVSTDGTRRYLFEVSPGYKIESVFIPEERRDTFCISTQVGCAVECLFCVTGRLPMRRNLTAGEIIGQVLALQNDRETVAKRLNIVIMGMGEPLHNYDNVMKAIRLMLDKQGVSLSPRRITLSTSGVVPGIQKLAQEPVIPNLAISLNATTDEVRDLLIPINRKWNIASLMQACREFPLENRRRITFEYVLIQGVNDTPEDALRLVHLLRGMKKKVNLIPLNADPWVPLNSPSESRIEAFQRILVENYITAYVRRPRGSDISAACGMLAGRDQPGGDRFGAPKPASLLDVERLTSPAAGPADHTPTR